MKIICIRKDYLLCAYLIMQQSDEVLNLRRSDIIIRPKYVQMFLEQSKTDIYRDGSRLILSKIDSSLCPI